MKGGEKGENGIEVRKGWGAVMSEDQSQPRLRSSCRHRRKFPERLEESNNTTTMNRKCNMSAFHDGWAI
jgi:hypothetical protein